MVAAQQPAHNAPFVMFAQKSNHLYLYEKFRGNNNLKGSHEQAYHIGIQQYDRWCQGDVPNELRTKNKVRSRFAPALWRLKRNRRDVPPRIPEPYTDLREGLFYTQDLELLRLEWLRQGKAPSVFLKHPTKIVALN